MVLSIVVTIVTIPAFAAAPAEIFTFQGLLKDSSGSLITGQRDITLRIYNIATGGTASSTPGSACPKATATNCLWQENQTNIGVSGGIFTITAGNQTSLNRINFTNALYLEVVVRTSGGNDQVLTPRINLTAAPFAISAMQATGTNSTSSLFNLNQKGIFNATQLFINQTKSSFTDTIVNITSTGVGTGVNVKAGSTVNNVLNITAGSLTTGSALNIVSGSGSPSFRNLVVINQNNTAADAAIGLFINQAGDAPALAIRGVGGKSNAGLINITASGIQPTVVIKSQGHTGILNITAPAATTNVVRIDTDSPNLSGSVMNITASRASDITFNLLTLGSGGTQGNIIRAQNASGAEVFKLTQTGITTLTQLKVNTTGTTLKGIFTGQNTTVVTLGTNTITVNNADGNDVAMCSFQSGLVTPATPSKTFFVTVGNVTTNSVFVNVTYQGPGSYPRAPFPLNCLVFDITP